jgi:hypothetical protein
MSIHGCPTQHRAATAAHIQRSRDEIAWILNALLYGPSYAPAESSRRLSIMESTELSITHPSRGVQQPHRPLVFPHA